MRTATAIARGALAAAALCAIGQPAASAEVKLRAASFLPVQASFGWPFKKWVDETNQTCDGKVEISVVGPEAIKPFEQANALKTGVIDMASVPSSYYKGMFVEIDTTALSEVPPAEMRKNGAWEILEKLHNEKVNAHYLTSFGDGAHFYVWTTKPANGQDFSGHVLRSVPLYADFFRALGADISTIQPADVYTALERGTVTGYGWPLWGVTDFGWHKVTKFRYEPGFFNVVVNVLVNLDKWKGMTDEQRQCLSEQALAFEAAWPQWRDAYTKLEEEKLKGLDIKVVDLGPGFAKKASDIYWAELEKESPETVGRLRKLLTKSQ